MQNLTMLLAVRYLLRSTYEKTISTMSIISFVGIMIGTFSLALVTAVMNGFEIATHEKMQSIHAQATIQAGGHTIHYDAIQDVINQEFPEVIATSPHSIGNVIIQSCDEEGFPMVVELKSIDPEKEIAVSAIGKKLYKTESLSHAIHDNHIVIGKSLARNLSLTIGMPLALFYLDEPSGKNKLSVHETEAIIGGIFDTGIDEYDSHLILGSHEFLRTIFPDHGITDISISLQKNSDEQDVLNRLGQRLGMDVYSWKDLYPALVSALKLEKYAMFFILALITLVASMNIIALLFMLITQKRSDIAMLRAMGASAQAVSRIFMLVGIIIATVASAVGLLCAWIVSLILDTYPFIQLPDVYYVSHLPVKMELKIVLIVWVTVILITACTTWLTVRRTRFISIAEVLRFEG